MAFVRRQIEIDADADSAWDAIRDFGAVHEASFPASSSIAGSTAMHGS